MDDKIFRVLKRKCTIGELQQKIMRKQISTRFAFSADMTVAEKELKRVEHIILPILEEEAWTLEDYKEELKVHIKEYFKRIGVSR